MSADHHSEDFLWRVEEACANAYPSPRELVLGGWLLRAAGGRSRRTNSVGPLRGGPRDPSDIVAEAERIYAGLGQASYFRVPDLAPEMDAALDRLGYAVEGGTRTLYADLLIGSDDPDPTTDLVLAPSEAWLEAWAALNGDPPAAAAAAYRATVESLLLPAVFACHRVEGAPVALAYGALDRGILVLESVVTHPGHRRRGYAAKVLARLKSWARVQGAEGIALQVLADNDAALALYRSAGFERELYRYHYRRGPRPG